MKISKYQHDYIICRGAWEYLKEKQKRKFNEFLSLNGLTWDSFELVGEDRFEELTQEFNKWAEKEIEATRVAFEEFKRAESALIKFSLSVIPRSVRKTLVHGCNKNFTLKQRLIGLILRLDISTLPKSLLPTLLFV